MDIRSMLTGDGGLSRVGAPPGPPRISTSTGSHTPASSFDGPIDYTHTPSSDVSSARAVPYGTGLHSADSRGASAGGYFHSQSHSHSQSQSPYPNPSAVSTPGVGPQLAWAHSPGSQGQAGVYRERDNIPVPSHNPPGTFIPPQPPTPGSATSHQQYAQQQQQQQQHSLQIYQQQYQHLQSQQIHSPPAPHPHVLTRQMSPGYQPQPQYQGHHQGQSATPLGPPIRYPRASPHRPTSRGGPMSGGPDHLRRASQSSISSIISHNQYPVPASDHVRRESMSRSLPVTVEYTERDRSLSVSPKTIPRPPPLRESSTGSQSLNHSRSSLPPQNEVKRLSHPPSFERQVDPVSVPVHVTASVSGPPQSTPARSISSQPEHPSSSNDYAMQSSPAPVAMEKPNMTKQIKEVDLHSKPAQSLKRRASHLSDITSAFVKRPRHERPRWAESARKGRPLNLRHEPSNHSQFRQQRQQRPTSTPVTSQTSGPASVLAPVSRQDSIRPVSQQQNGSVGLPPHAATGKAPFEGTISDVLPMSSLSRSVCDWIARTIGNRQPPPDSMFELEAKIGHILADGHRIFLPLVDSEVLLNTEGTSYRFKSEMSQEQHRHINEQLNRWTVASHNAYAKDNRTYRITSDHPKENDEFFELTEEGKQQLHPEVLAYINNPSNLANTDRNGRKQVRVRRSINKATGQVSRNLIKTRIANREIHNPDLDFDYRISISLETGWEGDDTWLKPLSDTRGRNKDRMSYQHRYFHVDLTQVTHAESNKAEHELEVEVNAGVLEGELMKLRLNNPESKFSMVIDDLLNNTRVLCREGGKRTR